MFSQWEIEISSAQCVGLFALMMFIYDPQISRRRADLSALLEKVCSRKKNLTFLFTSTFALLLPSTLPYHQVY
jgi:hypothetical protein